MAKTKRRKKKPKWTAEGADLHVLYQHSVQDTDWCIKFLQRVWKRENTRRPKTLREDFCGTALLCAAWVKGRPERRAIGLDLDRPTLDWGRNRNIAPLGQDAKRVQLLERNVLDGVDDPVDVAVAFNFSYWVFHDRPTLVAYFRNVFDNLRPGGFFAIDIHGGPEAQQEVEEERKVKGFTYVWEQGPFDPIANRSTSWIHFRFKDGTRIEKAFTYDWRIWSLPELRDVLVDAGFHRVDTYWDCEDDVVRLRKTAENWDSWIAYLVGWKLPSGKR